MTINPFVVGPQAAGEAFFGREAELQELEDSIFSGKGAISLVGCTRIGKSSLASEVFRRNASRPQCIRIMLSMAECMDGRDFWNVLADQLRQELEDAQLEDARFSRHYKRIDGIEPGNPNWFERFKTPLASILIHLGELGWRLVLAIDEFDAVQRIFGEESHHYQFLRSIFSDPRYATSGVIISRRRLNYFEVSCPYISSFHGVFREMFLQAFAGPDIDRFYEILGQYGISVPKGGRKQLEYYTGWLPYLCCMFGERIVANRENMKQFGDKEIDGVYLTCSPQVTRHYEDLIKGIEEDHHRKLLSYLSRDIKPPTATRRDYETLQAMGILFYKEKTNRYYAFSEDFMDYFRQLPLKWPTWDTFCGAEKKLKKIFSREFSGLDIMNYQDLIGDNAESFRIDIIRKYPALDLDWKVMENYCQDLSRHKAEPTLLDVLTLSKIISIMLKNWDNLFSKYFDGDVLWKDKLLAIKNVRNPIAHAQIEYIDETELTRCLTYCEEIICIS